MLRLLGQKTGACFQRCVGMDASNAVFSTTYETDEKYGTNYHENFKKFWTYIQQNDLVVDGAEVVSVGYYTPAGAAIPAPVSGVNIVVTVYSNGVIETKKVLVK